MPSLYDSMLQHPGTGPVMTLLGMVDPVGEFERGLVLVRDCFSPNTTLRELSRARLRLLLSERLALVQSFEQVAASATDEELPELLRAHARQMQELARRPLPRGDFEV